MIPLRKCSSERSLKRVITGALDMPLEQTLLFGFEREDERYATYRTVLFHVVIAAARFQIANEDIGKPLFPRLGMHFQFAMGLWISAHFVRA